MQNKINFGKSWNIRSRLAPSEGDKQVLEFEQAVKSH